LTKDESKVKILSYRIQLVFGNLPLFMASGRMQTAFFSVRTDVTANPAKSPRSSGMVGTSTGLLFFVAMSEYGKGIPTMSAGWMIIPNLVFFVVPNTVHYRILGFFQILALAPAETPLFSEVSIHGGSPFLAFLVAFDFDVGQFPQQIQDNSDLVVVFYVYAKPVHDHAPLKFSVLTISFVFFYGIVNRFGPYRNSLRRQVDAVSISSA
jgi:hypothetical protein